MPQTIVDIAYEKGRLMGSIQIALYDLQYGNTQNAIATLTNALAEAKKQQEDAIAGFTAALARTKEKQNGDASHGDV